MSRAVRARDDEGSILLALFVILVTSAVALVLLGTALMSVRSTRHDQAYIRAVLVADAGLQQALDRVNTGAVTLPTTDGASTATYTAAVGTDLDGWNVTRVSSLDYLATSTATVSGVTRTVSQHIVQGSLVSFAVFADKEVSFQGNNVVGSYSEGAGAVDSPSTSGYVGSNGKISFSGGATATGVELYNNAGGASCGGTPCLTSPAGFPKSGKFNAQVLDATINAKLAACKAGGVTLSSYTSSTNTPPIHAGVNCFTNVTFDGAVPGGVAAWPGTPTNPVEIYVDGGTVDIYDTGLGAMGQASALRIYSANPATFVHLEHGATMTGLLWAPTSDCAGQPVEGVTIYGSLICSTVGRNLGRDGNGNFTAYFDKSLASIGDGTYSLAHFREEPTSSITPAASVSPGTPP